MDKKQLAEIYNAAVEDLGLRGTIDDDGDVVFKYPDLGTMFFSLDAENDPEYMMLIFPSFADKDKLKITQEQLLIAINAVNGRCKAVKFVVRPDTIGKDCDVMATVESFVAGADTAPSPEFLRATLKRNVSAVRAGVRQLLEEVDKIKKASAGAESM